MNANVWAESDAFVAASEPAEKSGKSSVEVRVASGYDDIIKAVAIRSSVFLGEEGGARFADHFDSNDACSTILIAYLDDEPVGTLRCRFFADFARVEKMAIRKPYRRPRVLFALVRAALRLCWAKGYRRIAGIARPEIVAFWCRKGGFEVGEAVETQYGPLVPMFGPLPSFDDIDPITSALVGTREGERRLYAPEGGLI